MIFSVKFWRKFWLLLFVIAILVVLQLFSKEIGRLEFSVCGRDFSIGIYLICICSLSFWFVCFIVKSFFVWFLSLFFKNKTAEEVKSINSLSKLIVADDYEFGQLYEKTTVVENFKILKIALALKRKLCLKKNFEKTGIHCIDIYIIKKDLQEFLKTGEVASAINLANKAIRYYYSEISVIQSEILEVAKRARYGLIPFSFDPSKFKYNLSQSFIDEYFIELGIVNFEIENDINKKLKILERLHRDYPANIKVLSKLLDFIFENFPEQYESKKVLDIIEDTISCSPNRKIVKYLLKIKRNDIFELTQSMMSSIPDNSIEKLWILLEIAMEKNFLGKTKEIIAKIIDLDESYDIYKFFAKHFEILSTDQEIIKLIQKGIS